MKKFVFLLLVLFAFCNANAQPIKRWKMDDLLNYIDKSDSALIINFWATFCGPCIEEIPYFQTIAEKYKTNKAKLLLVSLDFDENYPEKIQAFAKRFGFTAEIIWLDESKPDDFCPKIDSTWTGAMPATLFVNSEKKYRKFIEAQLNPQQVEAQILNLVDIDCPNYLPKPIGLINDFEDAFTEDEEIKLTSRVELLNKDGLVQIAVISINDYSPLESISLYAYYIGTCWGIGEGGKDNGVIILFSKNKREIWIANGYGIEKKISNTETKKIIDQYILPAFKERLYFKGTDEAIEAIGNILKIKKG